MGTFFSGRIIARQISRVTTVSKGTARMEFTVFPLIVKPHKYPLCRVSRTITWKRKIAKVLWLICLRIQLVFG